MRSIVRLISLHEAYQISLVIISVTRISGPTRPIIRVAKWTSITMHTIQVEILNTESVARKTTRHNRHCYLCELRARLYMKVIYRQLVKIKLNSGPTSIKIVSSAHGQIIMLQQTKRTGEPYIIECFTQA